MLWVLKYYLDHALSPQLLPRQDHVYINIEYIYGIIDVTCACIFHSVDAVEMRFGMGTMSEHELTIRRNEIKMHRQIVYGNDCQ